MTLDQTRHPTSTPFALWRLPSGRFVCGRASWVGTVSAETSEDDFDRIPPLSPPLSMTWSDSIESPRITRALDHIFSHVRKPVELEQLVTSLLIHLRIVTFAELAVAVELSPDELSAIWDQLPLSDLAIAERLDLSLSAGHQPEKISKGTVGTPLPFLRGRVILLNRSHVVFR
jgi:hypothetical protein